MLNGEGVTVHGTGRQHLTPGTVSDWGITSHSGAARPFFTFLLATICTCSSHHSCSPPPAGASAIGLTGLVTNDCKGRMKIASNWLPRNKTVARTATKVLLQTTVRMNACETGFNHPPEYCELTPHKGCKYTLLLLINCPHLH